MLFVKILLLSQSQKQTNSVTYLAMFLCLLTWYFKPRVGRNAFLKLLERHVCGIVHIKRLKTCRRYSKDDYASEMCSRFRLTVGNGVSLKLLITHMLIYLNLLQSPVYGTEQRKSKWQNIWIMSQFLRIFEINIRKCDKNGAGEHFDEKLSVLIVT